MPVKYPPFSFDKLHFSSLLVRDGGCVTLLGGVCTAQQPFLSVFLIV